MAKVTEQYAFGLALDDSMPCYFDRLHLRDPEMTCYQPVFFETKIHQAPAIEERPWNAIWDVCVFISGALRQSA